MILDCAQWTIYDDYSGRRDIASVAATVEDCRTECINNPDCTAIDWVATKPAGLQCWLVGPWTTQSVYKSGIRRHSITRTCGWYCGCIFGRTEYRYCVIFSCLAAGIE